MKPMGWATSLFTVFRVLLEKPLGGKKCQGIEVVIGHRLTDECANIAEQEKGQLHDAGAFPFPPKGHSPS